eukprot:scaffold32794_cov55-Phaeocystis_antarctica.AAC.1
MEAKAEANRARTVAAADAQIAEEEKHAAGRRALMLAMSRIRAKAKAEAEAKAKAEAAIEQAIAEAAIAEEARAVAAAEALPWHGRCRWRAHELLLRRRLRQRKRRQREAEAKERTAASVAAARRAMALDLDAAAARPSVSRRAPALLPPLLLCTSSVGEGYIRDHGGRSGSGDARSRSNGGGRVGTMANSPSMTLLTSPPLTRSASAAPAARRPSSSAAMRRGGNSPAPPTQPWTQPTTPSELWQQPQSEFRQPQSRPAEGCRYPMVFNRLHQPPPRPITAPEQLPQPRSRPTTAAERWLQRSNRLAGSSLDCRPVTANDEATVIPLVARPCRRGTMAPHGTKSHTPFRHQTSNGRGGQRCSTHSGQTTW